MDGVRTNKHDARADSGLREQVVELERSSGTEITTTLKQFRKRYHAKLGGSEGEGGREALDERSIERQRRVVRALRYQMDLFSVRPDMAVCVHIDYLGVYRGVSSSS
jgi:hypothetical protein